MHASSRTKKRKQVKQACVACQKAHACCGDERPCKRCVQLALGECVDAPRKKRGRKRKDDNTEKETPIDVTEVTDLVKPMPSLRKRTRRSVVENDDDNSQTEGYSSQDEAKPFKVRVVDEDEHETPHRSAPSLHHFSVEELEYKPSSKKKSNYHYPQRKKSKTIPHASEDGDNDNSLEGLPAFPKFHYQDKSLTATVEAAHVALQEHGDMDASLTPSAKPSSFASDYFLSQIKTLTSAIQDKNDEISKLRSDNTILSVKLAQKEQQSSYHVDQNTFNSIAFSYAYENVKLPMAMITSGNGGEFLSANKSFCEHFGLDSKDYKKIKFEQVLQSQQDWIAMQQQKIYRNTVKCKNMQTNQIMDALVHCDTTCDNSGAPLFTLLVLLSASNSLV